MSDVQSSMLRRIERESGMPGVVDTLAMRLPATDLQSLLLAVLQRRSARISPAEVLKRYERDRFVRPAAVSPRALAEVERHAHVALPLGFELLALSPVTPLGSVSALSEVSQNSVISTTRGTEVLSDVTNVLALECALRRRSLLEAASTRHERVELAAVHRVVRGQVWDAPGFSQHFSLLGLCTAGRDVGSFGFESDALATHIRFYIGLLERLTHVGLRMKMVSVAVTPTDPAYREPLAELVVEPLAEEFPSARIVLDERRTRALDYYAGACLDLSIETSTGEHVGLADGGLTGWTQQLLGNRKERLMISGLGLERVAALLAAA